jgi:hypothetical protein
MTIATKEYEVKHGLCGIAVIIALISGVANAQSYAGRAVQKAGSQACPGDIALLVDITDGLVTGSADAAFGDHGEIRGRVDDNGITGDIVTSRFIAPFTLQKNAKGWTGGYDILGECNGTITLLEIK